MRLRDRMFQASQIQPVNILGKMAQSTQLAANQANVMREAERQNLFRQYGAGALQGDANAMNALAAFDPAYVQQMDSTRRANERADRQLEMSEERLQMARASAARAMAGARDKEAAAAEAQKAQDMYARAVVAFENGDTGAWNMATQEFGHTLPMDPGSVRLLGAIVGGAAEGIGALYEQAQPDYKTLPGGQFIDQNNPQAGAQPIPNFAPPQQPPADEYGRYVAEMQAAGETPLSRIDYAQAKRGPQSPLVIQQFGSDATPAPQVPEGAPFSENAENAFGARGLITGGVNAAGDFVGAGLVSPEVQETQNRLNKLNTSAMLALSAGFPGRPSNLTREQIMGILPKSGSGSESARQSAQQAVALMNEQIAVAERTIQSGALSGGDLSQAVTFVENARSLREQYRQLEQALAPEAGASQSDIDLMNELLSQ